MRILIINGPNLDRLGVRDPDTYGAATLDDLAVEWRERAELQGSSTGSFQSNHEGVIVDAIGEASEKYDGLIINAGALTHYSYSVRDAVEACGLPVVEVHISNIHEREEWRHFSVLTDVCVLTIVGRGTDGYLNAIDHLIARSTSPPITERYGDHPDAALDVRIPSGDGPHGVAFLIHGGFWRDVWMRDLMDPVAVALGEAQWATINVEYTRGPGSYGAALHDISSALSWVVANADAHNLDTTRIVAIGHSAGGYLALKLAHEESTITAALLLAAVSDLAAMSETRPDDDPVAAFLGSQRTEAPRLWEQAELSGQPKVPVHLVHGMDDDSVTPTQSESYVQLRGGTTPITIISDCDHMGIIDPLAKSWPTVLAALESISS